MRNLIIAAFLAVSLLGCAATNFTVKPVPTAAEVAANPVKATQDQIVNLNAVITAAAISLKTNKESFTDAEYAKAKQALWDAAKYSDDADEFVDAGNLTGAAAKLKLADAAISLVQTQLIKLKNKENK